MEWRSAGPLFLLRHSASISTDQAPKSINTSQKERKKQRKKKTRTTALAEWRNGAKHRLINWKRRRRRIQPGSKRSEGGKRRALSTRCYSARSRREIQKHRKGGFLIRVLADRGSIGILCKWWHVFVWDPWQFSKGPASLYGSRVEL